MVGQVYFTPSFTLVIATDGGIATVGDCQLRDHIVGYGSDFHINCDPYVPFRTTRFVLPVQNHKQLAEIIYITFGYGDWVQNNMLVHDDISLSG